MDLKLKIQEWEHLIREAKGSEVKNNLKALSIAQVPDDLAVELAKISRRVGLPNFGVKVLYRFRKKFIENKVPMKNNELLEYSLNLLDIGARKEAISLLNEINPKDLPEAGLYQGLCHFTYWEYEAAIPNLINFLKLDVNDYQKLICKVNLSAAYIALEKYNEALEILNPFIEEVKIKNHKLLLGNALQLKAMCFLNQNELDLSEKLLNESSQLLHSSSQQSYLYTLKWKAVVDLKKNSLNSDALKSLHIVKNEAIKSLNWETVRDCDRRIAISQKDQNLLLHLYFGTPFPKYRKSLLNELKSENIPQYFFYPNKDNSTHIIDVFKGECLNSKLKNGKVLHKLLITLSSDFYKPFRIGQIFSEIFPEDYFNPHTAPDRVYFSIKRLRAWFKEINAKADIVENFSNYQLSLEDTTQLKLNKSLLVVEEKDNISILNEVETIKSHFGTNFFTAKEFRSVLKIPKTSASRILSHAIGSDKLVKIGSGPSTKYKIAS